MLKASEHRVKKMSRTISIIVMSFFLVSVSISRVEAHRLSIAFERIDVVATLSPECPIIYVDMQKIEILTLLGPTVAAGNITIKVYDPEGLLYVEGMSDEKGRFSFELPIPSKPGRWQITAKYPLPLHTASLEFYLERSIIVEQAPEEVWPVYMTLIAGLGYAIGVAGMVVGYLGWRARKKALLRP